MPPRCERWRRGVVMPFNRSALEQILAGAVDDSTEAFFLPIRHDGIFYQLWDLELFPSHQHGVWHADRRL